MLNIQVNGYSTMHPGMLGCMVHLILPVITSLLKIKKYLKVILFPTPLLLHYNPSEDKCRHTTAGRNLNGSIYGRKG